MGQMGQTKGAKGEENLERTEILERKAVRGPLVGDF